MQQSSTCRRSIPLLVSLFALSGCEGLAALGMKQEHGLGQVDELLNEVEQVQVESAVSKERVQVAFEGLRALLAPEFKGDAVLAHAEYVKAVDASKDQAEALQDSLKPLRRTGTSVFTRWTEDLESFGNIAMRQRSQERLEETRKRYDAILAAAVSAQLAYDGFNGDLSDHALFLEHDFNATSVAMITGELDGLKSRGKELSRRLDACAAACQAYVEFSAPSAQVAPEPLPPAPEVSKEAAPAPAPAAKKPAPKKKIFPKSTPPPTGQDGG